MIGKIYECKKCFHLEFNQVPEKCLACGAAKDVFVEKPDAIKKPVNPAALSEGDKKHIPQIVVVKECGLIPGVGCTDVHVRVGEIEHVMQADHYIRYVDFYLDYKFISRVWLSPVVCHAAAALHLNPPAGATLTALENCNKHGNWVSEVKL
jgi:desulfoferrodoxin-like iron-binding protein